MTDAPRPQGVVVVHGDGSRVPCELAYAGRNAEGIHMWEAITEVGPGDHITVEVMPPSTGIQLPARGEPDE